MDNEPKWEVMEVKNEYTQEVTYYVIKIEYAPYKAGGRCFKSEKSAQKLADKLNAEVANG